MTPIKSLVLAAAAWLASVPTLAAGAWVSGADDSGEMRVEARLLIDPDSRAGASLRAGVQLRIDPGWHVYWRNPGDSGVATAISWIAAAAPEIAWPAPDAFEEMDGELVTFGYAGQVLLASRVTPERERTSLGAEVELLACRESCIPASFSLSAPLEAAAADDAEVRALFAAHDAAMPRAASSVGAAVTAARSEDGAGVELVVVPCASRPCSALSPASGVAFFPEDASDAPLRGAVAQQPDGSLVVRLSGAAGALPQRLRGVLQLEDTNGARVPLAIDSEIAAAAAPTAATAGDTSLLAVLGLALLGGLVLNLMPCVLPVLAMKVFAVGELAHESRGGALRHGLAYAGGVELSLLALAGAALALRGAGHAVGWGFQFQEPAYVAVISAVLVGFALNLFGVFEIGFQPSALAEVGAAASGARRSFFEGLLAVALATPCSAPFLGTALGFAFASSAWVIVAVFLTIGAGLALPFVAISAFPGLARFMPRSGKWMAKLRAGLGFALLATVVWLLWIVGRSAGTDAVAGLLGVLLAGALVAWIYGMAQELRFAGVGAAFAVGLLVVGGANAIRLEPAAAAHASKGDAAWSHTALNEALAAGRPAFVYFSADWCLTCKMNERVALETPATRALLRRRNYAVLHGDWTRRDETIRAELAAHGKAGVPLYLVYSPQAPSEPQVLPELITEASLAAALERAVSAES